MDRNSSVHTSKVDVLETAARLATVAGRVGRLEGHGASLRTHQVIDGIDVVDRGVATPWSVQAHLPLTPLAPRALEAAVAWCRERGGDRGFRVSTPTALCRDVAALGLVADEGMDVYVLPATLADQAPLADVPELEVGAAHDRAEVVSAYGGWMSDVPLATALVRESDLASPARAFIVGRVDGRPVGCALVWFAAGTAYLSGIGVVPDARRRGYGRALTEAAIRLGARGPAGGAPPDLIWMHATSEGAALYSAMGFELVDRHLLFGPGHAAKN